MSKVTPFPYYNDLHDSRYAGLKLTDEDFKLKSEFKVKLIKPLDQPTKGVPPEYDVPLHRFNFLNQKLREFPVKEKEGNIKLVDFEDGFGQSYAYRWKNNPGQGLVGYTMKFDTDKNITISAGSRVNSTSQLFCGTGSITVTQSNLKNCIIFATGEVTLEKCNLENCYIVGEGTLSKLDCKARIKLIGKFKIEDCKISDKAHFLLYNPPELNQTVTSLSKCKINSPCELIGGTTLDQSTINGPIRIQGKSSFSQTQFSDNVQVIATDVSCSLSQLSGNCVVSQRCKITNSTISETAFIGGAATVSNATISGSAIITGTATVSNGTVSGGILTQSATLNSGTLSDHGLITGSSSVKGAVSGYGIVGGSGTSSSGSVSGLVTNGVNCSHGVSEGQTHWDNRSCVETQKNQLVDERKNNTAPGQSNNDQSAEPSIL